MIQSKKMLHFLSLAVLSFVLCACGGEKDTDDDEIIQEVKTVTTEATTGTTEKLTVEYTFEESSTEATTEELTEEQLKTPVYLDELETSLQNILANAELQSNTSVYIKNLLDESYVAIGGGAMQSASLIKLFVAGCVYENKEILLESENYAGETEELISKMISVSDNDATNTLVKRLGRGNAGDGMYLVNTYCQSHEFTDTFMGRLMLDFSSESDNYTSTKDCAHFLRKIYHNELVGAESILGYMKQQERTGKIPAGIPGGIQTANKTGELDNVENDVAIIYGEKNTYIICVMMNGLSDTSVGRSTITNLSSIAYSYLNNEE